MKATTGHIIFKGKTDYKDLAPAFAEVLQTFLEITGQIPDDEEVLEMFVYLNVSQLENNKKPEGYNRKGRMRLVFPIEKKEFYIRTSAKTGEVVRVTETVSKILEREGFKHTVDYNLLYNAKPAK